MSRTYAYPQLEVILDSIADGVFTVDRNWRITSFNRAAEEITGVAKKEALGRLCSDVLRADCCEGEGRCALRSSLETGKPVVNRRITIIDSTGESKAVSISTAIMRDPAGRVIGGAETFRDLTRMEELQKAISRSYTCQDMLSVNHRMREIFELLPMVAESTSTVLIEGESGTGKELLARAIHSLSPRAEKPFLAVNCGALPDTLLESELFGYKAGAFTDARKDKPGRFQLAEGGTVLLDEIGDISPALQVRLLRFLQEKEFEPLGGVKSVKADVRIIAATNKDLDELVEGELFRRDLYYRLNVVRLALPPLRERKEDIPLLVEHFVSRFNRLQGKQVAGASERTMAALMAHDWPGNVRELENAIERAFVLCRSGLIDVTHLQYSLGGRKPPEPAPGATLRQMEAAFLTEALKKNLWNRGKTARALGIHRSTLYRKIKDLGLQIPGRKN
ncbi:MAG: sigma 54-interacting transcriptional regulator [Candidatus Glassbacteria bacterium]|nr:sigma 54-interacting transcriptional regulator [Candidatus Glassbacteria bacterium]